MNTTERTPYDEYLKAKRERQNKAYEKYKHITDSEQALKEYQKIMLRNGGSYEDRMQWSEDAYYLHTTFGIVDYYDGKPYLKSNEKMN